ncbi:C39 family peptidase [Alkalilimnicola sp. S0819]|uniref:C39 family peptidase n=1 Tax=Alkalilimnicola sp. S0819 TaxID=2613922 RepID=UPI00126280B0|nr:C39 family peptidase [Alkalilimnicola sp. S0819]KAB7624393.1 C39 family peptidase [Alkalilimnicola sp. S0819]MPQ16220.1 peptidase C39 [Alkalilimnicola sp. S0819]
MSKPNRVCWRAVLGGLALAGGAPVMAGHVALPGVDGARVPVESYAEQRFRDVVKQQYDFSCGSAALATLLSYHYGLATTEQAVFQAMYEAGDPARIRREGFSLLDMKRYLQARGLNADGFRISLERLGQVGVPALALVNLQGYQHFVVVKGVRAEEVLVGDPSLGLRSMSREAFEAAWNGIFFVVRDRLELARASFNRPGDWRLRARAPLGSAFQGPGLASFTLSLPRRGDF